MHRSRWLAVLVAGPMLGVVALAGDEKGDVKPRHGGIVSSTEAYNFEVVFERGGLRVYPLTKDGTPIEASGLAGTATFLARAERAPGSLAPLPGARTR